MPQSVAAEHAIVGRKYTNARGTVVTVEEVPEAGQIKVRMASGTVASLARAYPLTPVDAPPTGADLRGQPIDRIRSELPALDFSELEDLADLDPRPEVGEALAAERSRRTATEATLPCSRCAANVAPMVALDGGPARVGVHPNTSTGVYCDGSGQPPRGSSPVSPVTATSQPALAPGDTVSVTVTSSPAEPAGSAEEEAADERCAEGSHTAGPDGRCPNYGEALSVKPAEGGEIPKDTAGRTALIRSYMEIPLCEAARSWPGYQAATLDPELAAQSRRLEEVEAARKARDGKELQRLATLKQVQGRPGVCAAIRRALAELQADGDAPAPSIRQADPAHEPAPVPLTVTGDNCPAALRETYDLVSRVMGTDTWSGERLVMLADVLSSVRDGRAALQRCEDVPLLRAAWRCELASHNRIAVLDQIRARIVALGGEPVAQENLMERVPDPEVKAAPPAPVETPTPHVGESALTPGRALQIQGATLARALELVAELDRGELADAWHLEEARGSAARSRVVHALAERIETLTLTGADADLARFWGRATARAGGRIFTPEQWDFDAQAAYHEGYREEYAARNPSPAAPPAPSPAPPPAAPVSPAPPEPRAEEGQPAPRRVPIQVEWLEIVPTPSGEDLWVRPPTGKPRRVGSVDEPGLAEIVAQVRARKPAPKPSAAPAVAQDAAERARAGLAALADALPALAALGLDVDIRIRTRRP